MQVIELFKTLCAIPHCSYKTDAMRTYLEKLMLEHGYRVEVDSAGNVFGSVEGTAITLQSHYDMVCIGDAPELELYEDEGWLHAKNSTLGADNGIGMAMMLALMQEGIKVDLLFTSDEEVGLLGARGLDVKLKTPCLLNLDSEEEGVVTIGCAGGVDIIATLPIMTTEKDSFLFEVEASGYPGGHSGIDIDKDIPNAIKVLASQLASVPEIKMVSFEGGQRRNAIAKSASALITSECDYIDLDSAVCQGRQKCVVINESDKLIEMLDGFEHGVRAFNDDFGIVDTSINLAQVMMHNDEVTIHLSARSMHCDALKQVEAETVAYFEAYGCDVVSEGFYPPWKPDKTPFSSLILDYVARHADRASLGAIHAGLECGIIKERYPDIDMASIGPNIIYPHSTREAVEIASVERVFDTLKEIVISVE
ncbi:MAG: M20/M25/M40 family metallo-hydrolase [Campylobacterota bacterium]|nr:M20/M25/M40 family metallo-hydrolase [Campylobacterota bacterium]